MLVFLILKTKYLKDIVKIFRKQEINGCETGFGQSGWTRSDSGWLFDSKDKSNYKYSGTIAGFVFMLVLMLLPISSYGQVLYGSLAGNITDPADAAVPGAKVEVTNLNTGDVKTATTDERGSFLFSDLQPGVYKVLVTMTAFKSAIDEKVTIVANNIVRFDTKLEVGDVNAMVNISSESDAVLQTDRSDINVVQTSRQVNDLPITGSQGRNYQSLLTIVPGAVKDLSQNVTSNGAGEANSAAGNPQRSISFNVNGVSRMQNNTRIDGSAVNYPWLPTNTAYVPTAESIQEVNIVTNAFDAEQGLAGGVVVNVITKSGTNGFHGSGWGYLTNSTFGKARNYFQTTPQNAKDILAQFGYAVGGPIWKNKLFFFTDLERTTKNNLSRLNRVSVAPVSLRPTPNGVDFSFLLPPGTDCNNLGNNPAPTGCIFDPLSNANPQLRTAFPGNIIPFNRISPAAATLISLLPMPTQSGFADNFISQGVATFKRTNFDNKINWNVNDKTQIWGRLSYSPTNIFEPPLLGEAGGDALNGGQLGTAPGKVYVFSLGGSYAITSNLIFDGVYGYTLQHLGAEFDLEENYGLDVLHIPGTNGPDRLQGGKPAFQVSSWANMGNPNTGNPFVFNDKQFTLANNFTWTKGAHSFRFGLDYQKQRINHFQPQGADFQTVRGTFRFNGNSTLRQNQALVPNYDIRYNSWADFLLGLPNTAGKADQLRNPNAVYMTSYALYARDRWQISPNLTINYGLRWERYLFPDKDTSGINRFDPDDGVIYTGGLSGVPRDTGAKSGIGQFLPRVGIAYKWGSKTVIRGGYGQSADPRPFIDFRNSYPIVNVWQMPTINNNAFIPVTTLVIGLVNPSVPPDLTQGILNLPANTGTTTYPKSPQRKAIHSFNFIVQRELPWRFVGSIGYVGTRAVGQMGFININASAPGTGVNGRPLFIRFGLRSDINEILPYKTTTYDSMQAELKRRWAGSTFGLAYTLSKTINYADNDANPRIQYTPEAERNKGLAGYDRRHNLQLYGVLDLPFGKGQKWINDGWASTVLGGWQVNTIVSLMSGTPINIVQGNAFNLNAGGSGQYPDQVLPEVRILGGIGAGNPYFDRSAFSIVNIPTGQPQRFGTAGRNNIIGPSFFNVDLGVFKTISFGERLKLQLRAEALNALNHPNFGNPQGDITNSNFGFITSTVGIGERNLRFAARITF